MIAIQRLTTSTFQDALDIWNEGFQGYLVDIKMDMEMYLKRMIHEGLSPETSIVAYVDGKPAGCVLNGIRTFQGKTLAWNGGTGVAPAYRRQGVGKKMIEACLDIYREHGVDVAFLEAIAANDKAIALYEQMGYQTIDNVTFLVRQGATEQALFTSRPTLQDFSIRRGLAQDVREVSFYNGLAAWQTQWQSIQNGESLMVQDGNGVTVGYALFKRVFDDAGRLIAITLYQCEADPEHHMGRDVIYWMLHEVFGPYDAEIRRATVNIRVSNQVLIEALTDAGFTTLSEQVFMTRNMKE